MTAETQDVAQEIGDEEIEEIAMAFLGTNFAGSKEEIKKRKNRARYKMKKDPSIRDRVYEVIEEWKIEQREELGGADVHRIMNEAFPSGW